MVDEGAGREGGIQPGNVHLAEEIVLNVDYQVWLAYQGGA